MLTTKEKNLLITKKKIDLLALGINPSHYYHVNKLLNRTISFIALKDRPQKYCLFLQENVSKITKETNLSTLPSTVEESDCINMIFDLLACEEEYAELLFKEWLRDKKIYHYMMEDVTHNYDFLSVPLPYEKNTN